AWTPRAPTASRGWHGPAWERPGARPAGRRARRQAARLSSSSTGVWRRAKTAPRRGAAPERDFTAGVIGGSTAMRLTKSLMLAASVLARMLEMCERIVDTLTRWSAAISFGLR